MAAYQTQQINVGSIKAPDVGSVFTDLSDRLNRNYQQGLENTIKGNEQARQQARYEREQELNRRQDVEYNRELGLRDARKEMATEFNANPYADKFGGGEGTKALDKQVLDYVNNGGEINADLAGRLQARYEQNRPFKEDAARELKAKMIALGEDPTKADAYANSMTSGMISRADQQARLDAMQQANQKWYDEQAKANVEAAKLNQDSWKTNVNNQTEITKTRLGNSANLLSGGGGSSAFKGMPSTYADFNVNDLPVSFMPAWTKVGDAATAQKIVSGLQAENVPAPVAAWAIKNSIKSGTDTTLDPDLVRQNVNKAMDMYKIGMGTGTGAQASTQVSAQDLMPKFAPRQIAGYDSKSFLEGSKESLPELFGGKGEREQVLSGNTTSGGKGGTLADKNFNPGNIKMDGTEWQGGSKGEGGFVKFDTPELGARALAKTIINGGVGHTVSEYMNKYAPPEDKNDTKSYTAEVAKAIGKGPNDRIGVEDVPAVMKAIARREGGTYSDEILNKGYALATNKLGTDSNANAKIDASRKIDDVFNNSGKTPSMQETSNSNKIQELMNRVDTTQPQAPAAPVPKVDAQGNVIDTRDNVKAGPSLWDDISGTVRHAYDNMTGGKGIGKPALATANAIAGQTLETLGSPYTVMKYGTDALLGNTHKPTVFQNLSKDSHDTAIKELSKVTEHPEEALLAAELATPFASRRISAPIEAGIERLIPKAEAVVNVAPKELRLPNYRPEGSSNWVNPNTAVATDKINGVGVQNVVDKSGANGNRVVKAQEDAAKAKAELDKALKNRSNVSEPNYWGRTKYYEDATSKMRADNEAQALWHGALDAFEKGQIGKGQLQEIAAKVNGRVNTRDVMESLDPVIGRMTKMNIQDQVQRTNQALQDQVQRTNQALQEFSAKGGDLRTSEGRALKDAADEALRNYNKANKYYQGN